MTWSALDILVVVLFLAQLLGWAWVVAVILKIKYGPVTRAVAGTLPLLEHSKTLASRSVDVAARLKARTLILLHHIRKIHQSAHVMDSPEGMWIEPRHVRQALGWVSLVRQKQRGTSPQKRVSIAHKLGLVPPALARLAPLGNIVRVALQAVRQLRP